MDSDERLKEKEKMVVYLIWMFLIFWCIALHYFAIVGFIASIERTWFMKERNLAYWKSRKIDVRNCIASADERSSYWTDLWNAYRFASRKVEQAERKILVRHIWKEVHDKFQKIHSRRNETAQDQHPEDGPFDRLQPPDAIQLLRRQNVAELESFGSYSARTGRQVDVQKTDKRERDIEGLIFL